MRHHIDFDKLINRFVPHYLGGRKYILFLQALMYPLRKVNDQFVEWSKETRIEATMTSQVFKLEWYLNRKFRKYFLHGAGQIIIGGRSSRGVPMFYENAEIDKEEHYLTYQESEGKTPSEPFYHEAERTDENKVSFTVFTPPIDTNLIEREAYLAMLSYYIDKYRIAGKTYNIKFYA